MAQKAKKKQKTVQSLEDKKRFKRERQEALAQVKEDAERCLTDWCAVHKTRNIAIAELIRYLNRMVKRAPGLQQRCNLSSRLIFSIYQIKDTWLRQNAEHLVDACLCLERHSEYVDWDALNVNRAATREWQDPDDYIVIQTYQLYAYTFLIDGQEFKFHSRNKIENTQAWRKPDYAAIGRSNPLTDDEITISCLTALRMAAIATNATKSDMGLFWHNDKVPRWTKKGN